MNEEGISEAEMPKSRPLVPGSQVNAKGKILKEIESATPVNVPNDKETKQPHC